MSNTTQNNNTPPGNGQPTLEARAFSVAFIPPKIDKYHSIMVTSSQRRYRRPGRLSERRSSLDRRGPGERCRLCNPSSIIRRGRVNALARRYHRPGNA